MPLTVSPRTVAVTSPLPLLVNDASKSKSPISEGEDDSVRDTFGTKSAVTEDDGYDVKCRSYSMIGKAVPRSEPVASATISNPKSSASEDGAKHGSKDMEFVPYFPSSDDDSPYVDSLEVEERTVGKTAYDTEGVSLPPFVSVSKGTLRFRNFKGVDDMRTLFAPYVAHVEAILESDKDVTVDKIGLPDNWVKNRLTQLKKCVIDGDKYGKKKTEQFFVDKEAQSGENGVIKWFQDCFSRVCQKVFKTGIIQERKGSAKLGEATSCAKRIVPLLMRR